MEVIAYVFAALVLVSAVSVVPAIAQAPAREEVKTALASIVDAVGILLPLEDALLSFTAVVIVYIWSLFGLVAPLIRITPIVGEVFLSMADLQHNLFEYFVIINKAWMKAVSTNLLFCCGCTAVCPACFNLMIMATRGLISYVLRWLGNCTIDLATSCMPLTKYFPAA